MRRSSTRISAWDECITDSWTRTRHLGVPTKSLYRNKGWWAQKATAERQQVSHKQKRRRCSLRYLQGWQAFEDLAGISTHLQDSRVHDDTDLSKGQILNKQQSEESTRNSLFLKFQAGQIHPCQQQSCVCWCQPQPCLESVLAELDPTVPRRFCWFLPSTPKLLLFFHLLV